RAPWTLAFFFAVCTPATANLPFLTPYLTHAPKQTPAATWAPADLQRIGRGCDGSRLRPAGYLHPVHIQPHCGPVISLRQMRPGVRCQRIRAYSFCVDATNNGACHRMT